MEQVLSLSPAALAATCSLSKRTRNVFFDAVENLKPSRGTQIIELHDRIAAKELIAQGLLKPSSYANTVSKNRFVMPRNVAFCTEEPTIAELLME